MTAPLHSRAYGAFRETQQRCLTLTDMYIDVVDEADATDHATGDILRAAVVLGVASMDAYFTRRFCELLVPFLKKNGPNARLIKLLVDAGLNVEEALRLVSMDRPFRRIRTLVETHLNLYTTQRFHAIDELFLGLGVANLSKNAQGLAGRKLLLRNVELLVDRRHQIVHEGDVDKRGKVRPVDGKELIRRLGDLDTFVSHADQLINKAVRI